MATSAIGNYIHLTTMGYLGNYTKVQHTLYKNAADVYVNQKKQMDSFILNPQHEAKRSIAITLEKRINLYLKSIGGQGVINLDKGLTQEQLNKLIFKLSDNIEKSIKKSDKLKNATIDRAAGRVANNDIGIVDGTNFNKAIKTLQAYTKTDLKKIQSVLNVIKEGEILLNNLMQINEEAGRQWEEYFRNLEKRLKDLDVYVMNGMRIGGDKIEGKTVGQLVEELGINSTRLSQYYVKLGNETVRTQNSRRKRETIKGTVKHIQKDTESIVQILQKLKIVSDNATAAGEYAEIITQQASVLIPKMAVNVAGEIINVAISKSEKIGDQRSYSTLFKDNFSSTTDIDKIINQAKTMSNKNNINAKRIKNASQDNIDVQYTLQLDNTPDKTLAMNFSIKSYTNVPKTKIHVLSGAPLLTLLQSENKAFVNQYINLNIPQLVSTGNRKVVSPNYTIKEQYNKLMWLLLAMKSISGYNIEKGELGTGNKIKKGISEYLVVYNKGNNNSPMTVQIKYIGDVLQVINNNLDKFYIDGYKYNTSFFNKMEEYKNNIIQYNIKFSTYQDRRDYILAHMQSIKIYASFSGSLLGITPNL